MNEKSVRKPSDCRILIVDDEKNICEFLKESLLDSYRQIDTAFSGSSALKLIHDNNYDVIVTDLKLPDLWGIDLLKTAKKKDEFTEVIVITGFASIESASEAINLGVTSYLTKPLSVVEFLSQVERAVSSRLFHLKSLMLMNDQHHGIPEMEDHLQDITNLYYFSRKLMLGLDIQEIMRIILDEANERFGASLCIIGVRFLDFNEIFAMPRSGELIEDTVGELLLKNWNVCHDMVDQSRFTRKEIPVQVFNGRHIDSAEPVNTSQVISIPMSVLGQTIGFLAVFCADGTITSRREPFLYVFTSLVSSIIEHGYRDMLAKMQAKTDSLTGVANHRMFHEMLEREIARCDRNKRSFCLALIDIDDFKKINDTHGHLVGDAVIIDLTRRIALQNRRGDILARYGGEEFALLLPETSLEGAKILAQRVCNAISSEPFVYSQINIAYSISIGLTEYDGNAPCAKDRLISNADMAMYESKHSGKNRVTAGI